MKKLIFGTTYFKIMKNIILGLFVFGLTTQSYAQVTELPEIYIEPVSYKFLEKIDVDEDVVEVIATEALATEDAEDVTVQPVKLLQREQAIFNLKDSEYYEDEYEYYFLSFYIPEGKILASYDKDGDFLRTIEKFKNTEIPSVVAQAVVKKYPGWTVSENVYLVNYHLENEIVKKEYKLLLERANQRRRVKTDENGNFL